MMVLAALDYIACEAFRIGFKAFWNVLVIVPAAAAALFPGPTRRFAKKAATRMLVHGAEMIAATGGLGILAILMAQATRGTLAGMIGITNPFPKLLVMLLIAVFGALGFRHMFRVFGDAGIPGPLRISRATLNTAFRTGRTLEGIDYTGRKINDLCSRLANGDGKLSGQGQAESASAGQKAPGRKPHPPASVNQPPSGPTNSAPTRPSRSGPGCGPSSRGGATFAGTTPGRPRTAISGSAGVPASNGANRAVASGGRATRATATADMARGGAAVLAPEVELPAAAAAAGRRARLEHGRSGPPINGAPSRSGPRADASHGQPSPPTDQPPSPPPERTPPRPRPDK